MTGEGQRNRGGDGQTVRMDDSPSGGSEPKSMDKTVPAAPPGRARWWLTQPRTTYLELPKKQQKFVLNIFLLGVLLVVTAVVLSLVL